MFWTKVQVLMKVSYLFISCYGDGDSHGDGDVAVTLHDRINVFILANTLVP